MIYPDIPEKALSIMQPWTWLIVNGHKSVENRSRRCHVRGEIAIHAGLKFDQEARNAVIFDQHPVTGRTVQYGTVAGNDPSNFSDFLSMINGAQCGGIVGVAELVDCVDESDDEFFVGPYGLVLRNARPVPFIKVPGAQGFFYWRKQLQKQSRSAAA